MAKKVFYSGKNLWLRTFDFFELGPSGKYTGVYGMVDGVQVVAGTPGAIPNRIELEDRFNIEVQEHHLDEEVGHERRIDRLKALLESQQPPTGDWDDINPVIEPWHKLAGPGLKGEAMAGLNLDCQAQEIVFCFDATGEIFYGISNWKE